MSIWYKYRFPQDLERNFLFKSLCLVLDAEKTKEFVDSSLGRYFILDVPSLTFSPIAGERSFPDDVMVKFEDGAGMKRFAMFQGRGCGPEPVIAVESDGANLAALMRLCKLFGGTVFDHDGIGELVSFARPDGEMCPANWEKNDDDDFYDVKMKFLDGIVPLSPDELFSANSLLLSKDTMDDRTSFFMKSMTHFAHRQVELLSPKDEFPLPSVRKTL